MASVFRHIKRPEAVISLVLIEHIEDLENRSKKNSKIVINRLATNGLCKPITKSLRSLSNRWPVCHKGHTRV